MTSSFDKFLQNCDRRLSHQSLWRVGTSQIIVDVVFVFSDPKNSRGANMNSFSSIFFELYIFLFLIHRDAVLQMHFSPTGHKLS